MPVQELSYPLKYRLQCTNEIFTDFLHPGCQVKYKTSWPNQKENDFVKCYEKQYLLPRDNYISSCPDILLPEDCDLALGNEIGELNSYVNKIFVEEKSHDPLHKGDEPKPNRYLNSGGGGEYNGDDPTVGNTPPVRFPQKVVWGEETVSLLVKESKKHIPFQIIKDDEAEQAIEDFSIYEYNQAFKLNAYELEKVLQRFEQQIQVKNNSISQSNAKFMMNHYALHIFKLADEKGINFKELYRRHLMFKFWFSATKQRCDTLQREDLKNRIKKVQEVYEKAFISLAHQKELFRLAGLEEKKDLGYVGFILEDCDLGSSVVSSSLEHLIMSDKDPDDMQQLSLFYCTLANQLNFVKKGGVVCSPVYTPDNQKTYDYEYFGTLEDFINFPLKNEEPNSWLRQVLSKQGKILNLASHLFLIEDKMFYTIKRDRSLFSFHNGMYNTQLNQMLCWPHVQSLRLEESKIAAANYIASEFHNEIYELTISKTGDWYSLPTPYKNQIFDAQEHSEEIKRFVDIASGRLLHRLGLDNWQFWMWFLGRRNTGKSTYISTFENIYKKDDIGTLSDLLEEKFGPGQFFAPNKKLLVVAPDIRKNNLPLGLLLSWITGTEKGALPLKGKSAAETDLNVPIMGASNVNVIFDSAQAAQRRTVYIYFKNEITNMNLGLGSLMKQWETAILLKKWTCAYHQALRDHGPHELWSWLPADLVKVRQDMAAESNSILYFLNNSKKIFQYDPAKPNEYNATAKRLGGTPFNLLGEEYNAWTGSLNMKKKKHALTWSTENCGPTFKDLRCGNFKFTGDWPEGVTDAENYKEEEFITNLFILTDLKKYKAIFEKLDALKEREREQNKTTGNEDEKLLLAVEDSSSVSNGVIGIDSNFPFEEINEEEIYLPNNATSSKAKTNTSKKRKVRDEDEKKSALKKSKITQQDNTEKSTTTTKKRKAPDHDQLNTKKKTKR